MFIDAVTYPIRRSGWIMILVGAIFSVILHMVKERYTGHMSPTPDFIGFAIIGAGMIAEFHANAIRAVPGAKLIGAYGNVPEERRAFCEKHGIREYASLEEVIADQEIHAAARPPSAASRPTRRSGCACEPSSSKASRAPGATRQSSWSSEAAPDPTPNDSLPFRFCPAHPPA